jgi:hypothetical protein
MTADLVSQVLAVLADQLLSGSRKLLTAVETTIGIQGPVVDQVSPVAFPASDKRFPTFIRLRRQCPTSRPPGHGRAPL